MYVLGLLKMTLKHSYQESFHLLDSLPKVTITIRIGSGQSQESATLARTPMWKSKYALQGVSTLASQQLINLLTMSIPYFFSLQSFYLFCILKFLLLHPQRSITPPPPFRPFSNEPEELF